VITASHFLLDGKSSDSLQQKEIVPDSGKCVVLSGLCQDVGGDFPFWAAAAAIDKELSVISRLNL